MVVAVSEGAGSGAEGHEAGLEVEEEEVEGEEVVIDRRTCTWMTRCNSRPLAPRAPEQIERLSALL